MIEACVAGRDFERSTYSEPGREKCSVRLRDGIRAAVARLEREGQGRAFQYPLQVHVYEGRGRGIGTWSTSEVTAASGKMDCGGGVSMLDLEQVSVVDSKDLEEVFLKRPTLALPLSHSESGCGLTLPSTSPAGSSTKSHSTDSRLKPGRVGKRPRSTSRTRPVSPTSIFDPRFLKALEDQGKSGRRKSR